MTSGTIISGDSHVIEPAELWTKPLGAKYGDAVPHIMKEFNGEKTDHFFTGIEYIRIGFIDIYNGRIVSQTKSEVFGMRIDVSML